MAERFGKGNIERFGRVWVLHLRGTSFERGLQHGTLMRYRIRDTVDFYRSLPERLLSRAGTPRRRALKAQNNIAHEMVKRLISSGEPEYVEELRGLAVGLGIRLQDLAPISLLGDLIQCSGSLSRTWYRASHPLFPGIGGTTIAWPTGAGQAIIGRNLDFWGAGYWDTNPAVIFHHPEKGRCFCSISTAGIAAGSVTMINEDGLFVSVQESPSMDADIRGDTILDLAHSLIRGASGVEEAIELAASRRVMGSWSILLAGDSPVKAAVVEVSPEGRNIRWLGDGSLVSTGSFTGEELALRSLSPNTSCILSRQARAQRSDSLAAGRRGNPGRMAAILGDHFDPLAGRDRSCGFSLSRINTISSVIASLPEKRFWISESPAPTSKGAFVGFDLGDELGGGHSSVGRLEGGRPPRIHITAAQDRYLDAFKAYLESGDLSLVLMILGECISLDKDEPAFQLMEGIVRSMVGNFRDALASVERSLELDRVEAKRAVSSMWKARILDMMDHREISRTIYDELAAEEGIPAAVSRAASNSLRTPFNEKNLAGLILDFVNGDVFE